MSAVTPLRQLLKLGASKKLESLLVNTLAMQISASQSQGPQLLHQQINKGIVAHLQLAEEVGRWDVGTRTHLIVQVS
jgi:hypothetical protein